MRSLTAGLAIAVLSLRDVVVRPATAQISGGSSDEMGDWR
jgi:hypothetical protein